MANSVLCAKCENGVHGRCAKLKRVTARLAMHFVCSKCKGINEWQEKARMTKEDLKEASGRGDRED